MSAHDPADLQRIYGARFAGTLAYRKQIWNVKIAPEDNVQSTAFGGRRFRSMLALC